MKLSYYVAYVLKHTLDAHPFYPDPTSFGWVLSEGTLAPIATEHLPTSLVCTDICHCCKCENQMADDSVDEEDYENLFGDFSDNGDDF